MSRTFALFICVVGYAVKSECRSNFKVSLRPLINEVSSLRNWFFALVAGVIVVGCGGGGQDAGVVPPPVSAVPTVNLGNAADVQIVYLSGQGRRAPGSQYAVIDEIRVQNSATEFIPVQATQASVRVQLDGYTINTYNFGRVLPANVPFETYSQFPFAVSRVDQEGQGGNTTTIYGGPTFRVQPPFDIDFRIFPGRQTSVQVAINDATLQAAPGGITFDRQIFEEENYDILEGQILSFLSDYVAFDISSMPADARPNLNTGAPAQMVLFSGDAIAQSSGFNTDTSFEILRPIAIDQGIIREPVELGGTQTSGTYTVLEGDPRVLPFGSAKLVALSGIWKPYTQVLSNIPATSMVVFPNSRGDTDNNVVIFSRNGAGQITALWQGVVRFTGSNSGSIVVYSINQVDEGTANNPASGTLSNFVVENGVIKRGSYNFTASPNGFPFASSGQFVVFRR